MGISIFVEYDTLWYALQFYSVKSDCAIELRNKDM